jgi:hypothetical protein
MAWAFLIAAGLFEVVWALGLKATDGFSRLWPSVLTAAAPLRLPAIGPIVGGIILLKLTATDT